MKVYSGLIVMYCEIVSYRSAYLDTVSPTFEFAMNVDSFSVKNPNDFEKISNLGLGCVGL